MTPSPAARPQSRPEKYKRVLYTMFSLDMAKLIAPERITVDMMRSEEWKQLRKAYYELFEPVMLEQEERKS